MSLRKWAAALISAPQALGHKAASVNKPTAPVKASEAPVGPQTLQRVNRLNHQVIKQATITSSREKCTPIFCPEEGGAGFQTIVARASRPYVVHNRIGGSRGGNSGCGSNKRARRRAKRRGRSKHP